jgi:uncharacterized protein YjgD (DUF1641 family)
MMKKYFDEQKQKMKEEYQKLAKDNEDGIKKNTQRIHDLEKDVADSQEKLK